MKATPLRPQKPMPHRIDTAPLQATRIPLHVAVNVDEGWIEAIEFGQVVDGRPDEQLTLVADDVRLVRRGAGGEVVGFTVLNYRGVDLDALGELAFAGPRFAVPALGLDAATLGEVVLAVRGRLERSTADVELFAAALRCAEDEGDLRGAADNWRSCLQAGDMRGHFGLGYTLYDLGEHREAYDHLRRYTELAPHNSWSWLWLGRAAEAIGETAEAAEAYRSAIRREREGSFRTDALERLRDLDARGHAR
jgi:tetratricopeptide (TPR) repeat protein